MSPATKSKSKDRKAMKEPPKGTMKASGHVNTSGGVPASGYNPVLGTFHTIETAPVTSTSPHHGNGRFRNIDDSDDHTGSSFGTGIEYDSVSNNDSWSGESEDQKDKTSQSLVRQESVPGADNDKREKIRQKNEKKHQRQKEKRAQELHERCSGYLMSRKLEALALQLVGMGFSQERATMALILNEGRVEDSVACLCEGTEEDDHGGNNLDGGGNLKIDISDELARIADLEIRYKATKQEVERVIVSCEGDLDSAEETLKSQKQEPPKLEENTDPPTVGNGKQPIPVTQIAMRAQAKPSMSSSSTIIQQKRDEKDFNYTKAPVTATGSSSLQDPGIKIMQVLHRVPSNKPDWAKQQQIAALQADKRRAVAGSNSPSVSYSMPSPLQTAPPPAKPEPARFVPELKNLQLGSLREPVIVMQRPQSINLPKQQIPPIPSSSVSSAPSMAMNWYPNHNIEPMKQPPVTIPRSDVNVSSYSMYNQFHHNQPQQFMPNSGGSSMDTNRGSNGMWSRGVVSPTLAPASSLGLFSGPGGSPGASSPVDWSTGGSMLQMDYASIDWSLDLGSLTSRPNGMWNGSNYTMQNNSHTYDSLYGLGMRSSSSTRPVMSNGNGELQNGVVGSSEQTGGSSRDWTSPFEEKDLFSLPRQFVSSPSL